MNVHIAESPITPPGWERCNALVRLMAEAFPQVSRDRCRQALAATLFYPSWDRLRDAAQNHAFGQPLDEQLSPEALKARRSQQFDVLNRALRTWAGHQPWSELEERSLRMIVQEILTEHSPSAQRDPAVEVTHLDAPCMAVSKPAWLATLPRALSAWWREHQLQNLEWVRGLELQRLDPFSAASIVSFSRLWGTVCSRYGHTLPASLLLGSAYVLAEHYALTHLRRMPEFRRAVQSASQEDDPQKSSAYLLPFCQAQRQEVLAFLEAYPRDDLAALYARRPDVFLLASYDAIEALGGTPRPSEVLNA